MHRPVGSAGTSSSVWSAFHWRHQPTFLRRQTAKALSKTMLAKDSAESSLALWQRLRLSDRSIRIAFANSLPRSKIQKQPGLKSRLAIFGVRSTDKGSG